MMPMSRCSTRGAQLPNWSVLVSTAPTTSRTAAATTVIANAVAHHPISCGHATGAVVAMARRSGDGAVVGSARIVGLHARGRPGAGARGEVDEQVLERQRLHLDC